MFVSCLDQDRLWRKIDEYNVLYLMLAQIYRIQIVQQFDLLWSSKHFALSQLSNVSLKTG